MDIVKDFELETGIRLDVVERQYHKTVEVCLGSNPEETNLRTNWIEVLDTVGFRIDLGQGCAIRGSLKPVCLAETTAEFEMDAAYHYDEVQAAVMAKCGVFNRELIG
ncbi:hypothetical protein [Mesorhizobium sp. M8A.F.Ca.ET.165.01.1.1]|uniref:hypothetical protein n=1 Tax=Mesorhizobium sp. M8A.F.Ca.ET.165.01.1.1 TaxID=2563960 RepID=UPI001093F2F6|nr:hypothetical protein [Mesorhizobium sp. M8A.F.Ca.ET.165.01.1.1]TGT42758.1 hypothetical protein EN808_12815 [Mesorhizobium sp. M8A.F.Ca.ET.165.01.1.1]